ncbi:transmembrane emp24 domain-containing protein p24delta7-like [Lotus japonicus]|uniref:transmembrane emp24 domain-containing protein p24delta7-like n=1 Tax=Lotus japonicus TaxID=34305 RepID=UPI00258E4BEB|nr:transmembrane emp24 domain-containing protein p24delta7-like [Lotus japonicus]
MSNQILFLLLVSPALMCSFVDSMRFELKSNQPKCINEDIKSNALTVGKYYVVSPSEGYPVPDSHKITLRVRSPYGNNYHFSDRVESGNFAFTAAEAGDYTACFSMAPDHDPVLTVIIDFEWRSGVAAREWDKVAKKGQLEAMEFELKKLYGTVTSIHDEMFYLRGREEEMHDLNRATNSKMFTFSFLSLLVCLSVAGLQLWHLKAFFERKKLL